MFDVCYTARSRSQALPGTALPARLCRANVLQLTQELCCEAEPRMQCVPRQSLGTRDYEAHF